MMYKINRSDSDKKWINYPCSITLFCTIPFLSFQILSCPTDRSASGPASSDSTRTSSLPASWRCNVCPRAETDVTVACTHTAVNRSPITSRSLREVTNANMGSSSTNVPGMKYTSRAHVQDNGAHWSQDIEEHFNIKTSNKTDVQSNKTQRTME